VGVARGIKAWEEGVRTVFVSATAFITNLGRALAEGRLEERLKILTQPQLLIVDEIGYLPIDRQGASWCLGAMSAVRSSSPAIRVSGPGARCSAIP